MHIPPILDDELINGYRGRLMVANNQLKVDRFHQLLEDSFPAPDGRRGRGRFFASIAAALNVSIERLVYGHTLWHLQGQSLWPTASLTRDSLLDDRVSHLFTRLLRRMAGLCMHCIQDDLARPDLHMSFWCRSHQVPGVLHCWVHRSPLLFTAPCFERERPQDRADGGSVPTQSAIDFAEEEPIARRLVFVLRAMLAGRPPQSREHIHAALSGQGRAVTGASSSKEAVRILARRMRDEIDPHWMGYVVKSWTWRDDDYPAVLMGALVHGNSPVVPVSAALVAATIFDSEQEACAALLR